MGQSWSGIRKQLEQENICDALKGRVQYFATRYRKSHDQEGRIAIRVDGQEVFKSSYIALDTSTTQIVKDMPELSVRSQTYEEYWDQIYLEAVNRGILEQCIFCAAFYYYQNHSMADCLACENAAVRLLAVLDRRVGKRRLQALLPEVEKQPDWLKCFYRLRMDAEGITAPSQHG